MKYLIVFIVCYIATSTAMPQSSGSNDSNDCSNDFCIGKANGNYAHPSNQHQFIQCIKGEAHCQSCQPSTSVFSSKCNQCLNSIDDKCIESPVTSCPSDACPVRDINYIGRISHPSSSKEYIDYVILMLSLIAGLVQDNLNIMNGIMLVCRKLIDFE